jgi:hypothetical protein
MHEETTDGSRIWKDGFCLLDLAPAVESALPARPVIAGRTRFM